MRCVSHFSRGLRCSKGFSLRSSSSVSDVIANGPRVNPATSDGTRASSTVAENHGGNDLNRNPSVNPFMYPQTMESQSTFLSSRASYQDNAMTDFVSDYRELGRLAMWDELLGAADENFRVLDVCSGTGRFTQAFYELVLAPQSIKVVHDYTDLCGHSLDVLRDRMIRMGQTPNRVFVGDCQKLTSMIDAPYNLIVNMHGLYGIPLEGLPMALNSMYDALAPGGHLVIAIGSSDSLYQRVPLFLSRAGLLKSPYTNSKNISKSLAEVGIDFTLENIVYYEEFGANDSDGLQRFVMDECGGNTFSVEDAQAQNVELDSSWDAVKPLINLYFDPKTQRYKFKQEIAIFKIEKKLVFAP